MADANSILLLIITVLLLAIFLFIGDKIFGNKAVKFSTSYYLKAIITAAIIIALIIGVSAVVGQINVLGIGGILPILVFVVAAYAIRGILMEGATYERSVWVGLVAWTLVYVVDYLAGEYFDRELIQFI